LFFPQGTGTIYRKEDQIYTLNQPSWIITRAGETHSYHFGETAATRHLFFHFSGGEWFAPTLLSSIGSDVIPVKEGGLPSAIISQILHIAHGEKNTHRCHILLSALLSELEHLGNKSILTPTPAMNCLENKKEVVSDPAYPLVVSKALTYIRNRLLEPITVAEIAVHCQLSHEHLTRVFVRAIGIPLRQMIIQLRLERATHMLRHSTLSIKEIASQCGYAENHYFSRAFTAYYGMTATEYRKEYADPRVQHIIPDERLEENYPINVYFHITP
jgi:AraC family transcriptional regulator